MSLDDNSAHYCATSTALDSRGMQFMFRAFASRASRLAHLPLLCIAGLGLGCGVARAQIYSLVDLGGLGGSTSSIGLGINAGGLTTGQSANHAFVSDGGTMTDLGTLPGGNVSSGTGINATGQIAGSSGTASGFGHAFLFTNGTMADLGTLPGGDSSSGSAINSTGQITGASYITGNQASHAFLYSNGAMTDLGTLPGGNPSWGYAINDSGVIAGQAVEAHGFGHAVISNGTTLIDLGTLAGGTTQYGYTSWAYGINNSGQVVGFSSAMTGSHAFLYSAGTMSDLGTLGGNTSAAYAINDVGQITGYSYTTALTNIAPHAFLYFNGVMTDLNFIIDSSDPLYQKVVLSQGNGINDNGWIVAISISNSHAYLLVPVRLLPRSLTFGDQTVGTNSAPQSVAISNTGTNPFAVTAISVTTGFSQTNNCPASSLPLGATCTVQVSLTPVAPGPQAGSLNITSGSAVLAVSLAGGATIPISVTASATTVTVGVPITLSWASTSLATCDAIGGATGDGWSGSIATSGTRSVTETAPGQFTYTVQCTVAGISVQAQAVVTDTPGPTTTLTASATSITTGQPVTLTWDSTNATSCTGGGGGTGDGWAGAKATSGSATITESSAGSIAFTIICTAGSQSANASAQVVVSNPSSGGGGGGGGSLNLLSLASLFATSVLRWLGQLKPSRCGHSA